MGATDPILAKTKNNITKLWLISFLNFFTPCFDSISFCFQTKVIKTKTKKGLSYFRSSHWRCSIRKSVLKNHRNFTEKNLCGSLFVIKLHAFRPVTKYCVLVIVEQFLPTKQICAFSLFSYHQLQMLKKSLTCFFFFFQVVHAFSH